MIIRLIAVGIGGFTGAMGRYLVSLWAMQRFGPVFPAGTLLVNGCGAFLAGFLLEMFLLPGKALSNPVQIGIVIGFLGALTTFSTFSWELVDLVRQNRMVMALVYLGISLGAGIGATITGVMAGRFFFHSA